MFSDKSNNVLIDRCALSSDLISTSFSHLEFHGDEIEFEKSLCTRKCSTCHAECDACFYLFDALN